MKLLSKCVLAAGMLAFTAGALGDKDNKMKPGKGPDKASSRADVHADIGVTVAITAGDARDLAKNFGLTAQKPLPPGIRKQLARGKPLPPGIARSRGIPQSMAESLPHYDGHEWRRAGSDLVLVALATNVLTEILYDVFE